MRYCGACGPWPVDHRPGFTFRCGDRDQPSGLLMAWNWCLTGPEGRTFEPGDSTVEGRWEMPNLPPGASFVWTWKLRPVP